MELGERRQRLLAHADGYVVGEVRLEQRRRLDNEDRQPENRTPGAMLPATIHQSGERRLEPLERVRGFSIELGAPQGTGIDTPMVERGESGKNA